MVHAQSVDGMKGTDERDPQLPGQVQWDLAPQSSQESDEFAFHPLSSGRPGLGNDGMGLSPMSVFRAERSRKKCWPNALAGHLGLCTVQFPKEHPMGQCSVLR